MEPPKWEETKADDNIRVFTLVIGGVLCRFWLGAGGEVPRGAEWLLNLKIAKESN